MADKKVLVIVPFPLDDQGVANRKDQLQAVDLGPGITFDFRPVKAAPALYDSHHDYVLADISIFEAGPFGAGRRLRCGLHRYDE